MSRILTNLVIQEWNEKGESLWAELCENYLTTDLNEQRESFEQSCVKVDNSEKRESFEQSCVCTDETDYS